MSSLTVSTCFRPCETETQPRKCDARFMAQSGLHSTVRSTQVTESASPSGSEWLADCDHLVWRFVKPSRLRHVSWRRRDLEPSQMLPSRSEQTSIAKLRRANYGVICMNQGEGDFMAKDRTSVYPTFVELTQRPTQRTKDQCEDASCQARVFGPT